MPKRGYNMSYLKKAVKGSIIIFILGVLSQLIGFITRIIFARNLTVSEYGAINAIIAFFGFMMIFKDFGLSSGLSKFIPHWILKNDKKRIKSAITYTLMFKIIATFLLSLIILFFIHYLVFNYFKISSYFIFIIFLLNFIFLGFIELMSAVFIGYQNQKYYSMIEVIRISSILIISLILFVYLDPIYAVSLAYACGTFITAVFSVFLLNNIFPNFMHTKFVYYKKTYKEMWAYSLPIFVLAIGGIVIGYTDTLMITYFLDTSKSGLYNVALPTAYSLLIFSTIFSVVTIPLVSELYSKKLHKSIIFGIGVAHKYMLLFMLPLALLIASFSKFVITLLYGAKYLGASISLTILVCGTVFYVLSSFNSSLLNGVGKSNLSARIFMSGAVLNILLNYYLIPRIGIEGAAIATAISYFTMLAVSIYYIDKEFDYSINFAQIGKIFFSAGIFFILINILRRLEFSNPYREMSFIILVSSVVYLVLLFALRLISKKEIKDMLPA